MKKHKKQGDNNMSDLRELPLEPPEVKEIYREYPVTITMELDVQVEARD